MKNKLPFILLVACLLAFQLHARVITNSNLNANQLSVEQQARDIQEQLKRNMATNCQASGGQVDSYSNCNKESPLPSAPNLITPPKGIPDPRKNITPAQSEAAFIAKNRSEIVQRCGLSEDAKTKITSMKDSEKEFQILSLDDPITLQPRWLVTYSIDTGNVVFGERQFERRTCWIVKKTGQAFWR